MAHLSRLWEYEGAVEAQVMSLTCQMSIISWQQNSQHDACSTIQDQAAALSSNSSK
jgi:midasin (ATPase involved in ribosome maturation)